MISDQRIQRNVQSLRCGRKWFNWCWGVGKVDTCAGVSWYLVSNNIYHVFNWKLLQFKFVFNWICICAWLSWYQYSLNIICPIICVVLLHFKFAFYWICIELTVRRWEGWSTYYCEVNDSKEFQQNHASIFCSSCHCKKAPMFCLKVTWCKSGKLLLYLKTPMCT